MYARRSPLTEKEMMPSFLRSHIGSTRQETAVPVNGDRDKLSSSPVIEPNRCRDADCYIWRGRTVARDCPADGWITSEILGHVCWILALLTQLTTHFRRVLADTAHLQHIFSWLHLLANMILKVTDRSLKKVLLLDKLLWLYRISAPISADRHLFNLLQKIRQ